MDYNQAWRFLDDLQFFKIKLGLDAMENFLAKVGNPQHKLPCIHIGGTNGKGSVGATLLSILTRAGYNVGLYTSPHLSSVRERFRIGKNFISEEDFAETATDIHEVLGNEQITYFEFTTALALLWFSRKNVDLAIMEVGMGGRLDATNSITPLVSVITNVSMDHEQYLGNTLEEITREKAGIIKSSIPVVTGVANDASSEVMRARSQETNSPMYLSGRDFSATTTNTEAYWNYNGIHTQLNALPLAMKGNYQMANASLALAAIELLPSQHFTITEQNIRSGLADTRWPGRLEEFRLDYLVSSQQPAPSTSRHYLLDGAHNPAGVAALCLALENEFSYNKLILVWGAMSDKDITTTLTSITPLADHIFFTRPESERSALPDDLLDSLPANLQNRAQSVQRVENALQLAAETANKDDLICIAGSLYLVGRARQLLLGELV